VAPVGDEPYECRGRTITDSLALLSEDGYTGQIANFWLIGLSYAL
jgi:hypothetical protein